MLFIGDNMQKDDLIAMIDGLLDHHSQAICCDENKDFDRLGCVLSLWKSDIENGTPPPITPSIRNAVMFGCAYLRDAPATLVAMVDYFLETSKPASRRKSVST